jgi:hypothetical protein
MINDDASVIVPTLKELKANFLTQKSRPIQFRVQQLNNLLRGLNELRNEFFEAFKIVLLSEILGPWLLRLILL